MKRYDQHLHSRHSFDCRSDPADVVRHAIERGLDGITFTEHYDTHPDEAPTCIYDDAAYSDTISRLRDQFSDRIRVGKGIEVDYQKSHMPAIVEFIDCHAFDVVLLSVHWCYELPIHVRGSWDGADPAAVTRRYFYAVRDALEHVRELHAGRPRVFDALSHLDFVKRYSLRFTGTQHVAGQSDLIDDILRHCLAADVVPEVNTSTLRQGVGEAMPGPATVQRYAALGGTMLSIGSDAHKPEDVGADFTTAIDMLRAAGIDATAVYVNRDRRRELIDA
ncbi:MAG: histidinol-phosphatase HisJ family protein [Phycisphaerales bacterium]|nr:histidinol-phosphatase HisJ family protein [Phycisphaerales bacterium]